jgi:Metal-dependent hydrolases of the beta-lactamase superfamily I
MGINVEFHGVRGSTPCAGPQYTRYGGHSSCVSLTAEGHAPLLFDLGTGLTPYGEQLGRETPFHGSVLLTHMHWDHVQGLPFFRPLHMPESTLEVFGPRQEQGTLGEVFNELMRPPFFPVRPDQLGAALGSTTPATTTSRSVRPRCGRGGCVTSAPPSATGWT